MNARKISSVLMFVLVLACASIANSTSIPLQQATATLSQAGLTVSQTIDGTLTGANGWAISTSNATQTAVFESVNNVGGAGGAFLTFTIIQNAGTPFDSVTPYTIGLFRLSVTNDPRSTFADGLQNGGDVTATWTQLTPLTATSGGGQTFTINGDNSVSVTGANPLSATYTVTALTALTDITGFRLEAIKTGTLAGNGTPGRASNSNFILTEFQVDAIGIPEPSTFALWGLGVIGLAVRAHRRRLSA